MSRTLSLAFRAGAAAVAVLAPLYAGSTPTLLIPPAAAAGSARPDAAAGTISPSPKQRAALRRLIESDAGARALFAPFEKTAKEALTATPNPIALIQSEGKLAKDPVKIRTQQSLGDMSKIAALGWMAALYETPPSPPGGTVPPYTAKAKEFILAWADTNRSKGDPIDDTKLEPLLIAYDLTRAAFTADEQARVATYLRQVAAEERRTEISNPGSTRNNWHSHRLKIVGMIAFILNDRAMIDQVVQDYRHHIDGNLLPDGSSTDFHTRDALHYHLYDVEPLLTLAIAARQNGVDLYSYASPTGASLAHSVEWLIPYCDGSKTHAEFVNSKVSFDKKRAESGESHYTAGRLFSPRQALNALSLAAAFDAPGQPRYATLEKTVAGTPTARFVSWQDVLNAATAPTDAPPPHP